MKQARFQIYRDSAGKSHLLIEERVRGIWLALILENRSLCFLSPFALERMTYTGHASFDGRAPVPDESWLLAAQSTHNIPRHD